MKTYVQITGGRGPIECARAVYLVAEQFRKEYPDAVVVEYEEHNHSKECFMSITFEINRDDIDDVRKNWNGTVLWVATGNRYRPHHKRKNWYVGVNFIDNTDLIEIDDKDIRYETSRSSGAGGQNVNKVETSVKAIHIPTGVSVKCEDERSQYRNKEKSRERLVLKLNRMNESIHKENVKLAWNNHTSVKRGNPVKTFRGAL